MGISRRQFLKRGAGAVALGAGLPVIRGCPDNSLLRTVEARTSVNGLLDTSLTVKLAQNSIGGDTLFSRTYEGKIPAPTFRMQPGDTLRLRIKNELPDDPSGIMMSMTGDDKGMQGGFNATNFHSHGLHVSPKGIADNPYRMFLPGTAHDVEIQIPDDHPEGTYWYHPHHHGAVTVQLMGGMAGALIVEGETDTVPEIAAATEHIMIIQEIRIDANGETPLLDADAFHGGNHAMFPGSTLHWTINGQVNPTIIMRPGEVQRWRFIQAGVETFTPLALDGHVLHQIAMDGITFAKPAQVDKVLLAPGNRADVLVKAGTAGTYSLRKLAYNQGQGEVAEEVLATIKVQGQAVNMGLPKNLPTPSSLTFIEDDEIVRTRQVTFSVDSPPPGEMFPVFAINGKLFDPDRIDEEVPIGSVEEWIITSATSDQHPFHIHVQPFQVTQISGNPVKPKRWQDTVIVPGFGLVRVRMRFTDFLGKSVFHCHILTHEDLGMMANFRIVKA